MEFIDDGITRTAQDGAKLAVELSPEIVQVLGVACGSPVVLHVSEGRIETEILPPPSPELKESARRIHEKYKERFEELKPLGD